MAALQADGILDLVQTTLKDLGEMKITEIATPLRNYVAMNSLMKKNRVSIEAGQGLQWDVMVTDSGSSQFVGLYNQDNPNQGQVLKQATLPWRHSTTNYIIDEREIAMNRSPRKIVDLLKIRRIDGMISLVKLMEDAFWTLLAANDDTSPHGVPYHIVKNATEGFNGGRPSGFSDVSGLDPNTYDRWRNWTAQYAEVTKDDLVRKWRRAARQTDFQPPVEGIPDFNTGNQYGYYTCDTVIGLLEELAEGQNENLGVAMDPMANRVVFARAPVTYVPKLDSDTQNPIYGINWGVFKTVILQGRWMKEVKIANLPNQHNVMGVWIDNSFNWLCRNRRLNFVLATA